MSRTGVIDRPVQQADAAATCARIGPNALIQTVRALREQHGETALMAVLSRSGQPYLASVEPETMVDEREFARLVEALTECLGGDSARQILQRSGQLTAVYLLQHRIPQPFQHLLKWLPRLLAIRLFLFAISQHAWTFVGSGRFSYVVGKTTRLEVVSGITPVEVVASFYGGTFEHLIRTLVAPKSDWGQTTHRATCIYSVTII